MTWATGVRLRTLQGSLLPITVDPTPMIHGSIDGHLANIVETDIDASNGVMHRIDAVLFLPPPLPSLGALLGGTAELSTMLELMQRTGVLDELEGVGPLTLFAPDDSAFSPSFGEGRDLRRLLRYHIVDGLVRSTMLSTGQQLRTLEGSLLPIQMEPRPMIHGTAAGHMANIGESDIVASNGIVHKIDTVLPFPAAQPVVPAAPRLAEVVAAEPELSSLLFIMQQAGVLELLNGTDAKLTVFAPSNDAFASAWTRLQPLLVPQSHDALKDTLRYHIVEGIVSSADLATGARLRP